MTQEQLLTPFIKPHQLNFIREKLRTLIGSHYFVGDAKVVEAVKLSTMEKIVESFIGLSAPQRALLEEAANVRDKEELQVYINKLIPCVIPLPKITAAEIRKLFPKVKKLVLPNLEALDYSQLTFIGWRDIATNSLYLVHHIEGKWVGTECKYVLGPKNRTYICTWCKKIRNGDEAALVTTQVKNRAIEDGYKTHGNHLCLNSDECNKSLTTTEEMDAYLRSVKSP